MGPVRGSRRGAGGRGGVRAARACCGGGGDAGGGRLTTGAAGAPYGAAGRVLRLQGPGAGSLSAWRRARLKPPAGRRDVGLRGCPPLLLFLVGLFLEIIVLSLREFAFFFFLLLSNRYTQCVVGTHSPETKSRVFYPRSRPDAPGGCPSAVGGGLRAQEGGFGDLDLGCGAVRDGHDVPSVPSVAPARSGYR